MANVQFEENLTSEEAKSLKKGDRIQYLDPIWHDSAYPVEIIDSREGEIKIHYIGWNNAWDEWVKVDGSTYRFAKSDTPTIKKPPEREEIIRYITFDLKTKEQDEALPSYADTETTTINASDNDQDVKTVVLR